MLRFCHLFVVITVSPHIVVIPDLIRYPEWYKLSKPHWIPAYAGMTGSK
jgi:hypothetical protein